MIGSRSAGIRYRSIRISEAGFSSFRSRSNERSIPSLTPAESRCYAAAIRLSRPPVRPEREQEDQQLTTTEVTGDSQRILDQGYVIFRGMIPPAQLDPLRRTFEAVLDRQRVVWARERKPGDPPGGVWETSA